MLKYNNCSKKCTEHEHFSRGEENLFTFSLSKHKAFFENFLGDDQVLLLEDKDDFWKFVSKYESMLRNSAPKVLGQSLKDEEIQTLQPFHKRKLIALQFSVKYRNEKDWHAKTETTLLSNLRIAEFKEIVLIYLDFKQKEKFSSIKRLRQSQKSLPVWRYKSKIQLSLKESRVILVAGDTGCGKSTQIPQYLHEFGYKSIACTQPRRLACVSLSKRVAHEMLNDYGCKVGFQIRFEKNRTSFTNILFITEGLLLRQLAIESNLDQYDVLILDEIHERNLFGDFLLGVAKCILRAKPTLKLILMSATINVGLFYSYFKNDGATLIQVPGRLFPIKIMYIPPPALELKKHRIKTSKRLDPAPFVQILNLIDQKYPTSERGDVLIFVSGVNEIVSVCDAINEYAEENSHWIALPLHSGLSIAEQDKVFDYAPDGMRKCIVSTNIAETSLTVDGIRFVIDSGKVKEMSYDSSCKGQRLKEFWISKSSAEQRTGRAGRTGPGTCFRLYSQEQYEGFEPYPTPEIFRVPLDTILLQMVVMGLPNVRRFPFIETPSEDQIEQTILALKQHNAFTPDEKITPLGRALSNLPVEISIGKMLLMGCVSPDIEKVLTVSAALSVQNPFTSRAFTDPKCEQERSSLESDQGDILTLLRIYNEWLRLKLDRGNSRKWCHKLGIEEQRFYEIAKLRNQFQNILVSCKMTATQSTDSNFTADSSSNRARRHGEVRLLKSIKRKQKYQDNRERKILRKDTDTDFINKGEDIRDIDFRLYHDSVRIEMLLNSSNIVKVRDVMLLKLIMISGFYPQIAIADEFNYCKGGSNQFFHTALKPFVSIYPNAYFAKYFDILKLKDSDILPKPDYYTPKQILSSAHQVLCFQNLLETAKPYIMNCIRMPAAQVLLLFSYSIDTNLSITSIVCDSWLCLDFPSPETGCDIICQAINLRKKWKKLLTNKLNGEEVGSLEVNTNSEEENDLWEELIDFMRVNVGFTIKRLLPGDLKNLYTYENVSNYEIFSVNPFDSEYAISKNDEKGGINVTENVVYGSVNETKWSIAMDAMMRQHSWKCKYCDFEIELNTIKKLLHKKECRVNASSDDKVSLASKQNQETYSTGKEIEYRCIICGKKLHLTKIEILKHRKFCK